MRAALSIAAVGVLALAPSAAAAPPWGPFAAPNPFLGPLGSATMHGDAGNSDATPLAGPGARPVTASVYPLAAACPTLLQGADGLVVALCTAIPGRLPTVHLIDPAAPGFVQAALPLAKGGLLGGVYAYLDHRDRLVVVDGRRQLLRIAHERDAAGGWRLRIDESVDLSGAVPEGDSVVGLVPDSTGAVWFATARAVVGRVDPGGAVSSVPLPAGEQVANSISATPNGRVAVATTFALYELETVAGRPHIRWRAPYDRGPARKPGQLSWGTGSTPVYFGPETGADYVAIVDNADEAVRLLVFRSGTGDPVCSRPVLGRGGPGSENAPIGLGRTVVVASTYGYPYPAVPEDAGPAAPPTAAFTGGMTRVDLDADGCHTVWDNDVRSSAVPILSAADDLIYTAARVGPAHTTPLDGFEFTVVDPGTGRVVSRSPLPGTLAEDPLQMAPLITREGDILQGTLSGILRVGV
ncbi:hypothetical protein NDR87_23610 [Nocardia sp. CDC159]|uniref:Uncharacterized protein n=1 Tax=Nocardia pulmonis TaxID=2951408 RepID=A0A9X2EEV5_9NOCA|nr:MULTISPECIES: hypothetical protein [Nocardia]MCM6776938.1 hypothetical protein [Nocardia pulmonis]MCM6789362.1 hypothetical protein [Nocardia sp. CDC159]